MMTIGNKVWILSFLAAIYFRAGQAAELDGLPEAVPSIFFWGGVLLFWTDEIVSWRKHGRRLG